MCGYSPCGGMEKHLICALSGVSLCGNIAEYGKPFKSRLKGKKTPKIDLYPDSKSSCLSIIQGQENHLSHRPINSAKGTGGLDFLFAYALLILCHSLFEVVIEEAIRGRKEAADKDCEKIGLAEKTRRLAMRSALIPAAKPPE